MSPLEYVGLLLLLSGAALTSAFLRRHGARFYYWGLAWTALIAAGLLQALGQSFALLLLPGVLLAAGFPGLMALGTCENAARPAPRWLPVVAAAYAVLRASLHHGGLHEEAAILALAVDPLVLLACAAALLRWNRGSRHPARRLLPVAMALLCGAVAMDAWIELQGGPVIAWMPWIFLGVPASTLQVLAGMERARDSAARLRGDLEDSVRRFEAIACSAYDLITETDEALRILWISPNARRVLGARPEELVGRHVGSLIHPDDVETVQREWHAFRGSENAIYTTVRVRHRDGSYRFLEGTARRYRRRGGERVVLVSRDVTERMEAEAALRGSEARFRRLGEHARDVLAELDEEGRLAYVSPNVERMLGWTPAELLGRSWLELATSLPEAPAQDPEALMRRLRTEGRAGLVSRLRHRDGSTRWVETDLNAFSEDGRAVMVSRDVTERVRLEEKLRQGQKLESLGLLAGGIAHDFNNLLMSLVGNVAELRGRLPADSPLRPAVAEIEAATDRASDLTQQLVAFSAREPLQRKRLELGALAREMALLVERTLPHEIVLERKLADDVAVEGDPTAVRQAILALLTNAREALDPAGGRVVVSTGICHADAGRLSAASVGTPLEPGPYAFVEVSDDGPGMDAETRERVFDPFFSTRGAGRGLGLATVQGIARSHGGGVEVTTVPGAGTRFRLLFPVAAAHAGTASPRTPRAGGPPPDWRGRGCVLVVDDDDAVRRVAVRALAERGFDVLEADRGREAVELFRRRGAEVRAVVLDLVMPEMQGDEVFAELRRYRPDVPVLFSSGCPPEVFHERVGADERTDFLHKPYRPDVLLERIRELLPDEEPANGGTGQ